MSAARLEFDHVHCSGRFDESVAAWLRAVLFYIKLCTALSVTEIDNNTRARVLQQPGWNPTWGDKGPRDDCGITTKRSQFKVLHEETYTLSHRRYKTERGNLADTTEAAYQVAQDLETGEIVVLGSIHTDHGMTAELRRAELRGGRVTSDIGLAYVSMVDGFFAHAEELMRQWHAKRAALSGDWNLNFREAWVRAYFRKHYPKWSLNWDPKHLPAKGTHGPEIIDGTFLIGLKVKGQPRILRDDPKDDHTAVGQTLVAA